MKIVVAAAVLFAATVAAQELPDYGRHPRNARAAAACANLFLDDGKLQEAKLFAKIAQEEELADADAILANARVGMRDGQRIDTEVERLVSKHPEKAKFAAEILLRGAGDLADRGRPFFDVHLALLTAGKLDPSLRTVADRWSASFVRAKLTPRNAVELLPLAAAGGVDFVVEIARRAMAMRQPKVAALYASHAMNFPNPPRRELALMFVECAKAFPGTDVNLKIEALRLAEQLDPTVTTYRHPRANSIGGFCGNVSSPFAAGPFDSDQRFFPAATYGPPLPPRAVLPDTAYREAQCRLLAPPMFPEPFVTNRIGRQSSDRIWDEPSPEPAPPCVERSTFDLVIGADGRVESVKVRLASFPGGPDFFDPKAVRAEEKNYVPILMKQKYRPGRINGTPVRSITRAGTIRNCNEQ